MLRNWIKRQKMYEFIEKQYSFWKDFIQMEER